MKTNCGDMRQDFTERLLRSYQAVRHLVQDTRLHGGSRVDPVKHFRDVHEVSQAVFSGQVSIGDRVSSIGWFSNYSHWYLPAAYSPYQLATVTIQQNDSWAMQMTPVPAQFPTGRVPFRGEKALLGFVYPTENSGFDLKIPSAVRPIAQGFASTSPSGAARPWIMNLDTGRGGIEPERWVHRMGDSTFYEHLQQISPESAFVFTDPEAVRSHTKVPVHNQPLPILFAPRYSRLAQKEVSFTARLVALDQDTLAELSLMGKPLTEKVYSQFWKSETGVPPFCLQVTDDDSELLRVDTEQTCLSPKSMTFLVEFLFEDITHDRRVLVSEEAFVQWIIPSIKEFVFAQSDALVLPDRWAGQLYGFNGPVFIYRTGPVEISITPDGIFSATTTVPLSEHHNQLLVLFKDTVTQMQRQMIQGYKRFAGGNLEVRTTYLTDPNWQNHFGSLLEGREAKKVLHNNRQGEIMKQEIQSIHQIIAPLLPGNGDPMSSVKFGIVTALENEFAAVKALLANTQEKSSPGTGAGRRYLEGRIPSSDGKQHSVVLALLPDTGNDIAGIISEKLFSNYPTVKHVIMCGIAGGVPNPNDPSKHVRLGDIVVSGRGGVVQYDFVKQGTADGPHEVTPNHPPRPPAAEFLEAVRYLRAGHFNKQPWLPYIEASCQDMGIERPAKETDILYDYEGEKLNHPQRKSEGPHLFTGTIASSNSVLRDPEKRDALGDKFQIRAVEMEGAGIADSAWIQGREGYFIVRGVCDYCDTHKDDAWQNYAAAVAAGFLRTLLESMPAQQESGPDNINSTINATSVEKNRDTDRLRQLMSTLHLPTLDSFIERGLERQLEYNCILFWEGFDAFVNSIQFRFYDEKLKDLIMKLHQAWLLALEHGTKVFSPGPFPRTYSSTPYGGTNEDHEKMVASMMSAYTDLRPALNALLDYVHKQYSQIEIKETDRVAWETNLPYITDTSLRKISTQKTPDDDAGTKRA